MVTDREHVLVQALVVSYPTPLDLGTLALATGRLSAETLRRRTGPDPRSYERWLAGPFTKTVRRARRGAKFDKATRGAAASKYLPGTGPTEDPLPIGIAVFAPTAYAELPKTARATQLYAEDLPRWDVITPGAGLTVCVRGQVGMGAGKTCAQVAHALGL